MKLQTSSNQLSIGAHGDDVARVQQALEALGKTVPAAERADKTRGAVLGAGTVAVLKAIQAELGLPATGVVDAATVKAINAKLSALATDPRVIRGSLRDANGDPLTDGFVEIYSQGSDGDQRLARSALNSPDGSYEVSYQPPLNSNGHIDLRIAVLNSNGPLETTPSSRNVLTDAGPLEVVDFGLSGDANQPLSEFELILDDLKPFLGSRNLEDLVEDGNRYDVSLLASQSGYTPEQIAALVIAHKLKKKTSTPAAIFYGLLRQGLPADELALHATHPDMWLRALKTAAEQGIVPKEIGGRKIEAYLSSLSPSSPARPLEGLLGGILNATELNTFVREYLKDSQNPDGFWTRIAADSAFASRAAALKLTAQFGALTNNHPPLVNAIKAMPNIRRPSDLARITENKWKSLIQAEGVGVPADTPGATAKEKAENYVGQIIAQVEAAFPTRFLAERLGASPVAKFLKGQASYDLKTTYPEQFFKENPAAAQELTLQDRAQLKTFQRLYRLTSSAKETIALSNKGIRSSQQISRLDRKVFAEQNEDILSADRANEIHDRALRASAIALAILGEHGLALNRTGLQVVPKLDVQEQKNSAANAIPDWETLFGTFDFCVCQECSSAHGPAAYFVDVLKFLDERGVKDTLFSRRPDLGDIELSCENTNTVLPFIDLVNEVLENAVVPPPPFAPLTLAAVLETDLGQTVATAALAASFNPPLQPGARVEVVEAGKRWRIWDEPFAYSVVKAGNALSVVARSRQTTGPAEERRATPQYRNSAAYAELSKAVYPWSLPFDLAAEEATVFLTHLGVSRRDLMEALRPVPESFDPNSPVGVRLAAERLGLTDTGRRIIVGEPLTPPRQPEEFWGSATVAALRTVQTLLDRSGLSFAELDALASTWFIDPGKTVSISAKAGAPVDTCDTTRLQITGLSADILSRMHRFVRLWRRLRWTIQEVDRAIHALGPDPNEPFLTNETLVRLDHLSALSSQLRIPVAQTLVLWKPIDTAEPDSLYRRLFYNPAVFKPQDEDFRLRPDGQELVHSDKPLIDHAAALQAAFRLDSASFALLAGKTDGKLSLGNLSLLYRHAILARQLGLRVQDLLTAIDLTGLDPFRADRSQETLRFVEVVKAMRTSGFEFAELDYLLRHRFSAASSFAPTESALAQTLMDVRAGLLQVDAPSAPEVQKAQKSLVIDRISAALSLPADVTGALLDRVSHGGRTALRRFLELAAPREQAQLSRDNARPQFETLEKLLKIATIIQTLRLPGSQLDWLFENEWLAKAPDPPANPVPFAGWYSLIQLQQLRQDLKLEDAALEAILNAAHAVVSATNQAVRRAAKKTFVNALSDWLGWSQTDLETLIGKSDDPTDRGLLDARLPEDYRGLGLISRLHRAMTVLKRLGVTAAQATEWCEASVTDANAKAIRRAAKAKYENDAWLKLATPLQNSLRDKQREALVEHLVARPAEWMASTATADANDLYSHFLIDVEMSSCQLTSRMKQAIGSVQLFAQRCLLGLEAGVDTDDPKWQQWGWMKNFRVWEANRKIWLYPENWIEPDLRDGKSPFFKELENELLQTDLTHAAAEEAFRRYLEKLDEVSRLEMAGLYEDEDKTLHVFGRTLHAPRVYYYRRREGATESWTPWEKVELDIEGDHLIPVVWNGKLMLIWPIFTEKELKKEVEMPEPGGALASGDPYWEIQLAWSEYQNGRWTGKNLSEAVYLTAYQGRADISFGNTPGLPDLIIFVTDHTVNPPKTYVLPRRLFSKELISFKALVSGETLTVQAFLRRDYAEYRPRVVSGPDSQIACLFGVFQFFGCRKIVTTAQITSSNFPLAPTGTKFDHMWFTQTLPTPSKLILADSNRRSDLISVEVSQPPAISIVVRESESVVGEPSSLVANKLDIPVLDQTPWAFRLLAPHQDWQFVGDRPFFFIDSKRTFLVTSTRSPVRGSRPDGINWVKANLATAWRDDYFPAAVSSGAVTGSSNRGVRPLTVLTTGSRGERIATQMAPVNLEPEFYRKTLLPTFWTGRHYRFENFHHPYLCEFMKTLNRRGIPALLSLDAQNGSDVLSFNAYKPKPRVLKEYPVDEVEFRHGRAYELYNWELFFHIPLLIADRLSNNQRFEEAQRWFHFIFDPTGASGGPTPQRYWRTKPFHDRLKEGYEAESVEVIEKMIAEGASEELRVAVGTWRGNPFSPHAVARLRTTAYQKTVVMKYIDNLIAWGDQLFRRDTLESTSEATQLYILAAEILGRRPEVIQRDLKPAVETFNSLERKLGELGNALEQIEMLVSHAGDGGSTGDHPETPDLPSNTVLYFCVPENGKLLGYWNTVTDRLFKIRHCMNIEGQVRQLPLFEPPIDPALLVRAKAAGLSISDVLSDISVSLPNYRFSVMAQKANELVGEVRNLGAGLLSALEKRDAEALSLLRSGQELRLMQAVREVRIRQIDEARATIAGLQVNRQVVEARKEYYESREFISAGETAAMALSAASLSPLTARVVSELVTAVSHLAPNIKAGSPTTAGAEYGGTNKGASSEAIGRQHETGATILNVASMLANRLAEYGRRQDEWDFQAQLATIELNQIDQQLIAAEIRLAVAERELRNHDQQIANALEADQFLRGKFTNQDLYQWTIGQVSGLYFQSYQLAYDLAKRAELCMQHELGLKYGETGFIRFGYWDSLKKGLLAGDHLAYDLKRLEIAYLDANVREYELTKHVSLVSLAPERFLELKETGACEFEIPEWLFDLDTPGHYRRRLQMVSVTIPSVTGPYTTIHCKLKLLKSSYRRNGDLEPGYGRVPTDEAGVSDDRFIDDRRVLESIVTSTGQNDAGLFEPAMRDERYLPFEGAGAISRWRLELPIEFRTFDYHTISDVVLHLRYTARDGGDALSTAATAATTDLLGAPNAQPLSRLFSLRHEFPTEWHRFVSSAASAVTSLTVDLAATRFPYFVQSRTITIKQASVIARTKSAASNQVAIGPGRVTPDLAQATWTGQGQPGPWTVGTNSDPKLVEDLFVIFAYGAN